MKFVKPNMSKLHTCFTGLFFGFVCVILSGCMLDVYTQLPERDANEMLAVLVTNGIGAEKQYVGDKGVTLRVEQSDLARAIDILTEHGFPRENKDSIANIFAKGGIISSPFEERVRYIYALGEELSRTLSEIDGVLSARVHIVMPEGPEFGEDIKPSSVAVFIKQRHGVDLDFFTPRIRRLISNAVEGVDYDNVTVVLVEGEAPQAAFDPRGASFTEFLPGLGIRTSDASYFWGIVTVTGVVLAFLVLTNILTLFSRARGRRNSDDHGTTFQHDHSE